jgi:hypothetical protein
MALLQRPEPLDRSSSKWRDRNADLSRKLREQSGEIIGGNGRQQLAVIRVCWLVARPRG